VTEEVISRKKGLELLRKKKLITVTNYFMHHTTGRKIEKKERKQHITQ